MLTQRAEIPNEATPSFRHPIAAWSALLTTVFDHRQPKQEATHAAIQMEHFVYRRLPLLTIPLDYSKRAQTHPRATTLTANTHRPRPFGTPLNGDIHQS